MLARWAVPFGGIDPATVKLDHLHAVAGRWIDDKHWASPKPWSIRPTRVVDGVVIFEIITLTDEVGSQLSDAITAGQPIRLGNQHGTILAEPQILAVLPWEQLQASSPTRAWSVEFLTPTTFGNGSRFSPWPDPSAIARSLTHRWNALRPETTDQLDEDPKPWRQIWVSDIDGRSEVLHLPELTISGFLGRIRYVCDDPAMARTFDSLLRFAEFAGVGRYSTRGLGAVRLGQTWEPSKERLRSEPRIVGYPNSPPCRTGPNLMGGERWSLIRLWCVALRPAETRPAPVFAVAASVD